MSMPNESQPMGGVLNQPEAVQSRIGAFNEGHGMPTTSPGQSQDQQAMNSSGPARVHPSGSGNGMSADQASNTMSGVLPTGNGQAESTYATKKWFEPRQS
jgi:hypothetical protein